MYRDRHRNTERSVPGSLLALSTAKSQLQTLKMADACVKHFKSNIGNNMQCDILAED